MCMVNAETCQSGDIAWSRCCTRRSCAVAGAVAAVLLLLLTRPVVAAKA